MLLSRILARLSRIFVLLSRSSIYLITFIINISYHFEYGDCYANVRANIVKLTRMCVITISCYREYSCYVNKNKNNRFRITINRVTVANMCDTQYNISDPSILLMGPRQY